MQTLYFEDYAPGQSLETSARTVTEADIVNFACLSGDFNPIHINAEFAKKGVFGERIAHGLLGLAILSGLIHEAGPIKESVVAFVNMTWKFMQTIKIGDTMRGRFQIAKTRGVGPKQGLVYFNVSMLNQRDETLGRGEWVMMLKKRAAGK